MRTIIDLPDDQIERLAELCKREGISRAEAIRRAVADWLERPQERGSRRTELLEATFGIWRDRGIDTDTYLAELRSEWKRERDERP